MDSKYSGYYVVWGLFVLFGDFIRAVFFLTFSLKREKCVFLMAVRARTHKSKPVLLSQHAFKQQSGFWTMSFSFNAWGEESLGTGGTDTYMNLQGCAKRDYFFDKRRCFWSKYFFECRLQQAHYKHIIGGGSLPPAAGTLTALPSVGVRHIGRFPLFISSAIGVTGSCTPSWYFVKTFKALTSTLQLKHQLCFLW